MKSKLLVVFGAMLAMILPGMVRVARADDAPLKIAVCDPLKIATQVQEYKDIVEKAKADRTALETEFDERKEKIKSMQDELKLLLPDSDQYSEKNKALMQFQIDTEVWAKMMDMDQQRKQKTANKELFDKIEAAVADIAKDRGYTLVISSHTPEIPDIEAIDVNTLNALLLQRTVLFNDPKLDITQDVVIALDKAYTAAGR